MARSPIGDNCRINYQLLAVMLLKHNNGQLPCSCSRPQPSYGQWRRYPHHLQPLPPPFTGQYPYAPLAGCKCVLQINSVVSLIRSRNLQNTRPPLCICCHTRYNISIGNVIVYDGTFYGQISVLLNLLNINNAKRVTVKINSWVQLSNVAEWCGILQNIAKYSRMYDAKVFISNRCNFITTL